jgi:glycosyltransferase involved in cell wall biosynthesis
LSIHVDVLAHELAARGYRHRVVETRAAHYAGWRPAGLLRVGSQLVVESLGRCVLHAHTNGHNRGSWLLAAAVGRASRTSILTLHSGLAPGFIDAHRPLVRWVTARFAHVVAVSEPIARALAAVGTPHRRIHVIAAFLRAGLVRRGAPAGMAELARRSQPLVSAALAPGREYGAEDLFAATATVAQRHPGLGLAVFGPGTRSPALQELAARNGLAGRVWFMGELRHEEGLGLLQAGDLFVRPTTADGDSICVREAVALGRRVVATQVAPRPAGVKLCAPDASSLATAMLEALATPAPEALPTPDADRGSAGEDGLQELLRLYRELGARPVASS